MKAINQDYTAGRQIVVFDQIDATYPEGVHLDATKAKARFPDGVIPAGTLVIPDADGKHTVQSEAITADNVKTAIGLTHSDIVIDDYPLVSVVMAGIVRKDALPDVEKTGVAFISAELKRLSFV